MKLTHIGFHNYKPFGSKQGYQLKPITILFGKNSAGKSAAARFPLLLSLSETGTGEGSSPISLNTTGVDFGNSYRDIVYNHITSSRITFSLRFDQKYTYTLTFTSARDSIIPIDADWLIMDGSLVGPGISVIFENRFAPEFNSSEISWNDHRQDCQLDFEGIFPLWEEVDWLSNQEGAEELFQLTRAMRKVMKKVNFIGPFRHNPRRNYAVLQSAPKRIGSVEDDYNGRLVPCLLENYDAKKNPILKKVQNWYRENFEGWYPDVDRQKGGKDFSIVMKHDSDPTLEINIQNVGEGHSQILPIVVRAFQDHEFSQGVDILEQPELHLHPAAHGPLADLLLESALRNDNSFIVETHSENIILRLQRRIAELDNEIGPEHVGLYWVDSSGPNLEANIKEIPLNEFGEVDFWPEGIFEEDIQESAALMRAQYRREQGEKS